MGIYYYFPHDVKLRILAHSRSFLANQKARKAIFGAANLLIVKYSLSLRRIIVKYDSKNLERVHINLQYPQPGAHYPEPPYVLYP